MSHISQYDSQRIQCTGRRDSEFRETLRMEPNDVNNYANLAAIYTILNRLDEAEAVYSSRTSTSWRVSYCS
jgi:hypothetical protein